MSSNPASDQVSENLPNDGPASDGPASDGTTPAPIAADNLLPPVEPPSGGFILQLFVFPAVIVFAVVMLGFLMTSMASQGDQDPVKIVAALRGSNHARWQRAEELASMMRLDERYPKLKYNTELASELAKLLDEEVTAGLDEKNSISLRFYLCRVLGEFKVADGVEVLLKTAREDQERDVRLQAISALAILCNTLSNLEDPITLKHPELVETFVRLSNDEDDLIRAQTAFTLGLLTLSADVDPKLMQELEVLAEDLYLHARFNAGLSLARQGNLKSKEIIAEMFDLEILNMCTSTESPDGLKEETHVGLRAFNRDTIVKNALKAAKNLVTMNPGADFDELRTAVEKYVKTGSKWQPKQAPDSLLKLGEELLEIFPAK